MHAARVTQKTLHGVPAWMTGEFGLDLLFGETVYAGGGVGVGPEGFREEEAVKALLRAGVLDRTVGSDGHTTDLKSIGQAKRQPATPSHVKLACKVSDRTPVDTRDRPVLRRRGKRYA